MADNHRLDFLELVDSRGNIISSAQWPAKFGYPEPGFQNLSASSEQGAFLKQEEMQDSTALGVFAVRMTRIGEHPIYVIGGRRLDKGFLSAFDLPADMRALLYQNRGDHFSRDLLIDPAQGSNPDRRGPPIRFGTLIDAVRHTTWK